VKLYTRPDEVTAHILRQNGNITGDDSIFVTIDPFNTRPVTVNSAPAGEQSLSTILDTMVPGLPVDYVTTGQSAAGMFQFAVAPGTSVPTVVAEFTANSATQSFGIWFGTDTGSIYAQNIFKGGAASGSIISSTAVIGISGNTLQIAGFSSSAVNSGTFSDSRINATGFGFFFSPDGGPTKYFSIDELNSPSDPARFLAYEVAGNTWAFAYEDGSDFDYNDMVVKVESIKRVPEPSILALLGAALVAFQLVRRKRGVS